MAIPKNVEPVAPGPKRARRSKKEFIGKEEEYWILRQLLDNEDNEDLPECKGLEVGSEIYFEAEDFYAVFNETPDYETKAKWAHLGRNARLESWFTVSRANEFRGFRVVNEELARQRWDELEGDYVLTTDGNVEDA